jgi:hypothetical protein
VDRELVERAIAKAGGNSALAKYFRIAPAETSRWARAQPLSRIARRALELYLADTIEPIAAEPSNGSARRRATDTPPLSDALEAVTTLLTSTPKRRRARVASAVKTIAEQLREVVA